MLSALLLSLSRLPLHTGFLVFVAFIPLLAYISQSKHRTKELLISGIIFSAIQISMVFLWGFRRPLERGLVRPSEIRLVSGGYLT